MTKQTINLGTGELTGDGESIRSAFDKVNDNFDEVYARNLNTDAQTLALVGDMLSISDGNSVDLSAYLDDTQFSGDYDDLTNKPDLSALSGNLFVGNTQGDHVGSVFSNDSSTQIVDATNKIFNGTLAGNVDGDVTGSVFGDDSTLLVDGVNSKIVGDIETASLRTSDNNIALGNSAGFTNQGTYGIALGFGAGDTNQGIAAIGIGYTAGQTTQGASAIAIGISSGNTSQGTNGVAIGYQAGMTDQLAEAVAIGTQAGLTGQNAGAIAIGTAAGETSQGIYSIAVGRSSGNSNQGGQAVAVGDLAGKTDQGAATVAIGANAGQTGQDAHAIAIGFYAGQTGQGARAIAIGFYAGQTSQADNSIIINATGSILNNTQEDSFVVKPIRSAVGTTILGYDAGTGEITHNASIPYPANAGVVWDGSTPSTVDVALDRLASYTQDFAVSTDAHWADPNPADITDAINRLAAAIYALNGNTGI
jgi:hypothetical protein